MRWKRFLCRMPYLSEGAEEKKRERWKLFSKNPGVHIVANVISLESLSEMLTLVKKYGLENLEITQITAARGREIAGQHLMDGQNPVFVLSMDGNDSKR